MAEHREDPGGGDQETAEPASPAAVAVALGRASRANKAVDAEVVAFLRKQSRLIVLQTEHLHEQRKLQTSRMRWGQFSDRMRAALQVMTATVGLAVAVVIAAMAWQAHDDHGVVIEALSVPPDLAQRGLSGRVLASELLDKLLEMQTRTVSARPASTYANNWGDDIKVEIPETGVSVGELNAYLRQWLGHQTRITGEVVRTTAGLAVTARAGGEPGRTFQGADADLDKLVQQAAETVYSQTQPYRFAAYLTSVGRTQEGLAAFTRLAQSGPAEERAWAYVALAAYQWQIGDFEGASRDARVAIALGPRLEQGCALLAASLEWSDGLGHEEATRQQWRRCADLVRSGSAIDLPARQIANRLRFIQSTIDRGVGDYQAAAEEIDPALAPIEGQGTFPTLPFRILNLATDHDVSGSRRLMAEQSVPPSAGFPISVSFQHARQFEALDDWASVVTELEAELPRQRVLGARMREPVARMLQPFLAYAYARTGRQAQAEALISGTPMDCDFCVVARGKVAAARQDWAAADRWFALVASRTPSIPSANTAWGEMLLAKGDLDRAIARLTLAHKQGPHFADPLELWGEALMKKGDLEGAARKFAEADKYAPRWGRNHLRWGQALARLGRADEARAQWRSAAGMDLSVADRADLDRMQGQG